MFRQKLPGMAHLSFPHTLGFVSTIHAISNSQASPSPPVLSFHSTVVDLYLPVWVS